MPILSKNKLIIISISIFIVSLVFLSVVRESTLYNRKRSQDEVNAEYIEKAINYYINKSGDVKLEHLDFYNGNSLKVLSGQTKWNDIVIAMQQKIKDKNNPLNYLGPILGSNDKTITYKDYVPDDKRYAGYKIDIYPSIKEAKVTLCKKESDGVVVIHEE